MFKHEKQLLQEVRIEKANPQYAVLMQEQLGGGNGEQVHLELLIMSL